MDCTRKTEYHHKITFLNMSVTINQLNLVLSYQSRQSHAKRQLKVFNRRFCDLGIMFHIYFRDLRIGESKEFRVAFISIK